MSNTNWTQPICERCWLINNTTVDPVTKVRTIRHPVTIKDRKEEVCSHCGSTTIFGAYVRVDPKTVLFPTP